MDSEWVTDLDGTGCADALVSSQAGLVAAEVAQVRLVAHWCDLWSGPTRGESGAVPVVPGMERSVCVGADGTPRVGEFAAGELGVLLGMTSAGARGLMRDVLDLRHRHPRLWDAVLDGVVRFFAARHVVRVAHAAGLSLELARVVDERVAPYLGRVPWGRMVALVEAAGIEADPEGAEQRPLAAELARFVRTGRSSEFGTKTIYARARAGDAIFFFAMCDRIAQILKLRGDLAVAGRADLHPADAAEREMDVLRSEAIGILATPARALALLAWAERQPHTDDAAEPEPEPEPVEDGHDAEPTAAAEPEPEPTEDTVPESTAAAEPKPIEDTVLSGDTGPVVDLSGLPGSAFVPPATLYVHFSAESWLRQTRGVVRVEDVGPVTVEQALDMLRHCRVTIRPVIDLNDSPCADGYEARGLVREALRLRHPVEVFPHGTLPSRQADADHTVPYRPPEAGGEPGQTTPDNLGPLGRYHHRLKTHGGWQCVQTRPGVYWWGTPHGHWVRVDRTGTHGLRASPPGVTIQDQPIRIEYTAA